MCDPHGHTPSEGHRTGYDIIHLNASVYVRVQQHHVRECFVTLFLTDQVYLSANSGAATEEFSLETFLLEHCPLICLHIKTQGLVSKQVEGTIELSGNQVISREVLKKNKNIFTQFLCTKTERLFSRHWYPNN